MYTVPTCSGGVQRKQPVDQAATCSFQNTTKGNKKSALVKNKKCNVKKFCLCYTTGGKDSNHSYHIFFLNLPLPMIMERLALSRVVI